MTFKPFPTLISLLLLSSTGFAAAPATAGTTLEQHVSPMSPKSRTQVIDEILQARAGGTLPVAEGDYDFARLRSQSTQHTVAVTGSRVQAAENGDQPRVATGLPATDVSYDFAAEASRNAQRNAATGKTRTEVVAELRQAIADGTFVASGEMTAAPGVTLPAAPKVRFAGTARDRANARADAIQSVRSDRTPVSKLGN